MSESEVRECAAPALPGWEDIYEKSLDCVHCGLCISSCPTYRETGRETASPRGRIYLMRGVAEGRIPLGQTLADEAHLCLGCRACETACPSGVRYGSMVEQVRHQVHEAGLRRGLAPKLERFLLRHIVAQPTRLHAALGFLAMVQRSGLDRGLVSLLPKSLRQAHALVPRVPPATARTAMDEFFPALGERRGHVALFVGCVMPELFGDVNRETARVLAANGFDVSLPPAQGCCGALHAHAGDALFAHELARKNVAAFAPSEFEAIVVNSAGCGAALRDVADWLPESGASLATRVRDICEWLDAKGWKAPLGRIEARVCYDDPCHLLHGQRVGDAPRRLLRSIPGIEWVEHADPGACCGAAGTYNVTQPEMSAAVLARKMASLSAADPDLIVSGNPGCLMQLRAGVAAAGLRAEVIHPITLLDRAISASA